MHLNRKFFNLCLWQQRMNWGDKEAPLYCLCTAWLMMKTEAYVSSALRKNSLQKKSGWSHGSIPFCCPSWRDESYGSFFSSQDQVVRETRAILKTCIGSLFRGSAAAHMLGASLCPVLRWWLQWSETSRDSLLRTWVKNASFL